MDVKYNLSYNALHVSLFSLIPIDPSLSLPLLLLLDSGVLEMFYVFV